MVPIQIGAVKGIGKKGKGVEGTCEGELMQSEKDRDDARSWQMITRTSSVSPPEERSHHGRLQELPA